jgi:hypothetical protein
VITAPMTHTETAERWSVAKIAEYLGVKPKHASSNVVTQPGFPAPVVKVSRRIRQWDADAVRRWAAGPEITPGVTRDRASRMTPAPWADQAAIDAVYAEAKRLTRETGIQYHVDHEIPIFGELVSGLHVETNLSIIPMEQNVRKSNTFQVE